MKPYYCGWDGGGTKTEVCCVDASGAVIADQRFGPLNLNSAPLPMVQETIRDCLAFMAALPGGLDACAALVIGTAGISNMRVGHVITESVRRGGYRGPLQVVGDQDIALAGALRGPGAVLMSGTGSVCTGIDAKGRRYRVGGYGHLIDDCGSGYALGRDILAAVVRAEDGRLAPTCLTQAVYEELGVDSVSGVITFLYHPDTRKKEIAALARLLRPALEAGDAAALAIAEKAAAELAEMVLTLWRKAELDRGELVMDGSVLACYPWIHDRVAELCQTVCPCIQIIKAHGTPAMGAAVLALHIDK